VGSKASILRPTSVRIGHVEYDLHWVDEQDWMAKYDKGQAGFFWADKGGIYIRMHNEGDQRIEDSLRETLLHEILHGCWHHTNMAHHGAVEKEDLEEWVVGTLSYPLIDVLRDNPDVMKYLLKP
jgi:hypothetical protein